MSAAKNLPQGFVSTSGQSNLAFQSPSNWKKAGETGRMVHGIFEGRLEKDTYGKENYKFTITDASACQTIDKEGKVSELTNGMTVILNASGSLDKAMSSVEIGQEVIVDYDGAAKIKKGPFKGKETHQFSVYVRG